ncbi:tyrosine-type recombinase/integrase [Desulforegula conservatrix]|uniref:tyrosine-type recombinase/integrase n=1 Tax=Desulforegula conservatrix TaxID=153026 RepID=UPI0004167616|nr:integrase arm-type DNA-binding domain-containing protein [Desulforegula conservatrix]
MPKKNTSGLTDVKVKSSKPADKAYKLFDGDGLFLYVSPSGGKLWRMKYRFEGKEKLLSFGAYPTVSLADAREKRFEAKKLLDKGLDPGALKKAEEAEITERIENTFENIAREWFEKFSAQWTEATAQKKIRRLETIVFPVIGSTPVKELKAPDVLAILRATEERGAVDLAHRLKIACSQVFRYAIATGRAERDPTADLRGALPPINVTHRAAIIEPEKAAELLRAIDRYNGTFVVRCALKLSPMFFVRPGELRKAEWADVDFDSGLWSLPDKQMKMKNPHMINDNYFSVSATVIIPDPVS